MGIEDIGKLAEMIKNAEKKRMAFIFIPTNEGFACFEVSEGIAKMALKGEESRLKAITQINRDVR